MGVRSTARNAGDGLERPDSAALPQRRLGATRARHRRRARCLQICPRHARLRGCGHHAARRGTAGLDADPSTRGGPVKPTWDRARAIADAVLYEGYLLYPYRATSSKNQSRWQFGGVGPPGASDAGLGEDDTLSAQFLIDGDGELSLVLRFLQLQHRHAERDVGRGRFEPVDELTSGLQSWVTWDEAVERELTFGPFELADLEQSRTAEVAVAEGM